jgi:anti-sigma factor RsiW
MPDTAARDGPCENTRARLHPYLTGRLAPAERADYLAHLDTCAPCQHYVHFMDDAIHLTCQELVELITAYLDGALPPREHARFEAHLSLCQGCRAHLAQVRETIRLTGALTEERLAPAAKADLLAAFRGWKQATD